MSKVIYLPTIQHTGTWFVIETLKLHPDVEAYVEAHLLRRLSQRGTPLAQTMYDKESFSEDGFTIIQQHIPLWEKAKNLHSPGQGASDILFAALICSVPTILPIRDPLLSLITARNRREKNNVPVDIVFMVHIWAQVVRDFEALNNIADPFYLPVDLLGKAHTGIRIQCVERMMEHCGLEIENVCTLEGHSVHSLVSDFCTEWPVVRSTKGKFENKDKYLEGDTGYFKKKMAKEWKELKAAEPLLRPFLERLGYENLIWWSK